MTRFTTSRAAALLGACVIVVACASSVSADVDHVAPLALVELSRRRLAPGETPADTPGALREREAANAELDAAKSRLAEMQSRMTTLQAYEATLKAKVDKLEQDNKDVQAEVANAQVRLQKLHSGGDATEAIKGAIQAEADGLMSSVQEAQKRIVALRNEQINVLTASLESGSKSRDLADAQRDYVNDIRTLARRLAAQRVAASKENETLAAAEQAFSIVQIKQQSERQEQAAAEEVFISRRTKATDSIANLNNLKRGADATAEKLRAANVELIRDVDAIIKRRDGIMLQRDSLRRDVALLNVIVRQLNESVDARTTRLRDLDLEIGRTMGIRDTRRKEVSSLVSYESRMKEEAGKLINERDKLEHIVIPQLQGQLGNISAIRDAFSAKLAKLQANITADSEIIEGLRSTRTVLRQRLLDLKNQVVELTHTIERQRAALADVNETLPETHAAIEEMTQRSRKLVAKIGNTQASLEHAEEKARALWLRRRGECQCDDLRYTGASTQAVATCMRRCADNIVVAGAVLMELSSPTRSSSSVAADASPSLSLAAASSLHLPRFRALSMEGMAADASASASVDTALESLGLSTAEAHELQQLDGASAASDASLINEIAVAERTAREQALQLMSIDAKAEQMLTAVDLARAADDAADDVLFAASASAQSTPASAFRFRSLRTDSDDASSAAKPVAAMSQEARLQQQLSVKRVLAQLDMMRASLQGAKARIQRILTHEESSTPATVSRLMNGVKRTLADADADAIVEQLLSSSVATPDEIAAQKAEEEAEEKKAAAAVTTALSHLSRFREVSSAATDSAVSVAAHAHASARHRTTDDPLAAVTATKVRDLSARAKALERDLAAKQSAVTDMETKRQLLSNSIGEFQRRLRGVSNEIEDAMNTLTGKGIAHTAGSPSNASAPAAPVDVGTQMVMRRRDILKDSLAKLRAQANELQDRVSLMTAAAAAADAQFKRLEADVARLKNARDGLASESASMDRTVSTLKFNAQARSRDAANGLDDLQRTIESDARARRAMEEKLAELARDEQALDSYFNFMTDANNKLKAHVAELRGRKEDLITSEAAITKEIKDLGAKQDSLGRQQTELQEQTVELEENLQAAATNLTSVSEQLKQADAERAHLSVTSADAALARDKLRADQLRYREQVDSLRRQLLTLLTRMTELNVTMTEAKAEYAEKEKLKAHLISSTLAIHDGIRVTNDTMGDKKNESSLVDVLIQQVSQSAIAAQHELTKKRAEVRKYTDMYRKLLEKLGRAEDHSVGDVKTDASGAWEEKKLAAGKEAKIQAGAGLYPAAAAIEEIIGDWEVEHSTVVDPKANAKGQAAAPAAPAGSKDVAAAPAPAGSKSA